MFTIIQEFTEKYCGFRGSLFSIHPLSGCERLHRSPPPRTGTYYSMRKPYRTDLTDAQWKLIKPLIPPARPGGRPREVNMREVLNTLFYQDRTGCQWDLLPP